MDQEALFAGIRAEPHDDVVRLAYADWLEEHDRPDEAELIRVQLALADTDDLDRRVARYLNNDSRLSDLEARASALMRQLTEQTAPALAALGCTRPSFGRGILEEVTLPASAFLAHGVELLRRFPVVGVRLTHVGKRLRETLDSPALADLRELSIEDGPVADDALFAAFADAEHLAGLHALRIADFRLGVLAAQKLAAAGPLAGLRRLILCSCGLTMRAMAALVGPSTFAGLEELRVEQGRVDAGPSVPIEWAAHLRRLRRLSLRGVGANVVAAFLGSSSWPPALTALDVSRNPIGAEGLARLTGRANVSGLRELCLMRCEVGDRGVRALAESGTLTGLEQLDLTGDGFVDSRISNQGAEVLARSPNFSRLRELDLRQNHILGDGMHALAESPALPRGAVLHLSVSGLYLRREALRRRFRAVNFV